MNAVLRHSSYSNNHGLGASLKFKSTDYLMALLFLAVLRSPFADQTKQMRLRQFFFLYASPRHPNLTFTYRLNHI